MSDLDPKAPSDMGANARRMRLERWACQGFSDESLEAGVVAEMRDALEEAEAGLCFAGADREVPADKFVPAPTLALRTVRRALTLARLGEPKEAGS